MPYNFSIQLTFQSPVGYAGNLFGFYSESADAKLAVQLSKDEKVILYYEDGTRDMDQPIKRYPSFNINVTDGE